MFSLQKLSKSRLFTLAQILFSGVQQTPEKQTFRHHFWYSVLEGVFLGVFALNEFVLLKALKGNEMQVGYLFQFGAMVLLASSVLNELLRRAKNKRKTVIWAAVITRSPLLFVAFFPSFIGSENTLIWTQLFLLIFLIFSFTNPLIMPIINALLKQNYRHENYGTYYGYASAASKIVMLIVTFGTGALFDIQPLAYRYVYPFLAVIGVWSVYILMKIPYEEPQKSDFVPRLWQSVRDSFGRMVLIMKRNRAFFDFQAGFMFYGMAWLMCVTVIAIFLEKSLHLSYSDIAFYRNYHTLLTIGLTPFLGKLLGRIDPRKFGIYTFLTMLLYLVFMFLTDFFRFKTNLMGIEIYWMMLIANTFYGFFGALMGLLWNIGSAYFAKEHEIADYQAVHLTFTGIRGAAAPLIGVWVLQFIGFRGVFLAGVTSLSIAILIQYLSLKKRKLNGVLN